MTAKIIDLATRRQSQARGRLCVDRIVEQITARYESAGAIAQEFSALADEDLPAAVRKLPEFVAKVRQLNSVPEALVGGPNQDWVMPVFGAVGDFYAEIDGETRVEFLRLLLRYLDGLNSFYAQNHVALLQDPLLITDVIANRPGYWSGTEPGQELLKRYPTVGSLTSLPEEDVGNVWVAWAVMWRRGDSGELVPLPVREWYYRRFSGLIDRCLVYPAYAVTASATRRSSDGEGFFEDCFEASLARNFDPQHHSRIRQIAAERPWLVLGT